MQGLLNFIKNPFTILKSIAEFFQEQMSKENGVRSIGLMLLTIPSIALLILYYNIKVDNDRLKASNEQLVKEIRNYERTNSTLKDSLRKELMADFVELAKSVKNLQGILDDNGDRNNKIKKYSDEVNHELNKVE